nr:SusC/RagA family TonB-linked outer membrane protein [Pedobacter sp. ASV19]
MKKLILSLFVFLFIAVAAMGQNRTITGSVKGDDGLPLPGVTVKIKGAPGGTLTSSDGKYQVQVPSGATALEFSYLGYITQTLPIGSQSVINATLASDSKSLSEVVVTALGIKREVKALGYAAQSVKGDDLTKADQGDVLKSLSGKIAGVQVTSSSGTPGSSTYIQLRGSNSLTGSNQPLFVIDGSPIDNSQNYSGDPSDAKNNLLQGASNSNRGADIDPNDIESITVLKGPAAAAIYGIEAANGAILITTKRGQAGKIQVDFNTGVSFDKVNRLPKLQNQWVKGGTLGNGTYEPISPFTSTNRYSWGANVNDVAWTGIPNQYDVHGDVVLKTDPKAKVPFVPYDNINSFFRTGSTFNNSVAISGGTDVATYRTAISNSYSNSIVPLQNFQRTSVTFAGDLKLSEKLKISTNFNYITSNGNMPQQGSNTSGIMLGLTRTPISFDNSNGATDPSDPKAYVLSDGLQRSYRNGTYDNPFWTINKNPYTTLLNRLLGNVQLDYNIGNGFSAIYRGGLDTYNDNRHQYYEIQSGAYSGGRIFDDRYTYRSINNDLIFSYTKKVSDKLQIDAKIGGNIYNRKLDELYTQGDGLIAPGFNNIYNAKALKSANFIIPYRKTGIYYDINLAYDNMLFFETTGRNDWTSTLPKGKNGFFYPSANLSFVFSELDGMKDGALSFGKIRASIAQVGKDPGPFLLNSYYVPTTFPDGYTSGISFPANGYGSFGLNNVLGNPNLKPEKTVAYELGTQLQFFNNRLGLDVTAYYSKGTDLIVQTPISGATGYQFLTLNSGSVRNKGLEVQVNGTPIKNTDFEWTSTLNFALSRSKVLELAPGVNQITLNGFTGTVIAQLPGMPAGSIYGYGYTRDNSGNIVIDDRSGDSGNPGYPISNTNVQKMIGNPNPKFTMGLSNTFTYKGLSLYTLVDWKFKGDIWNGTRGSLAAIGTSDLTNNRNTSTVFPGVLGHLNANGDLVHYNSSGAEVAGPGAVNSKNVILSEAWYKGDGGGFGNLNETFVEDGSYIKLREVSLSYNLSRLFSKDKGHFVKNLTAGVFARNIIIWTPYHGIDPETSLTGATSAQGIDYFNNPGTSSYGLNLKFKF